MFTNRFINQISKNNLYRNLSVRPKKNVNIFIRNAITQLKTDSEIKKTETVIDTLKNINSDKYNPIFLTNVLNAHTQKDNIKKEYTPKEFRDARLDLVSRSDIFVFIYDENSLSVSGGFELGYWFNKNKNDYNKYTVIILMNTMSTSLVKMLPNTTYIQLDNRYTLDNNHFPNLIKLPSLEQLPNTFMNILNKYE